jgi:LacI family transcriptional regulator
VIEAMAQKRQTRVTLQQVAAHAGVSRATASLIVRGSPNISEATREKVLESMRQLGYVYDRVAANLRSKSSSTVGLIITEIANPYFSDLLDGVHQELDKHGYTVLLGTTFDSSSKQDQLLSTMLEYRVGGVILCPAADSPQESIERFKQWDVPVVLVAKEPPGKNFDYIGADNVVGAEIAVKHLIEKGHRRIAFIGGTSESSPWRDRKQGYCNALQQAGIEVDPSLLIEGPITRDGGNNAVKKAISYPNPPTAVFCFNDIVAFGVMLGLKEVGLTPGLDVGVVGFDNIKEAATSSPSLTTVSACAQPIGTHAASLLHQRIEGFDGKVQRIILKPELIIRDSSSVPVESQK